MILSYSIVFVNSFFQKAKKKDSNALPLSRLEIILYVLGIILAVLSILVQALNNNVVGYDRFIGIPMEWIRKI